MLNMYLAEQQAQQHAAEVERDLAHRQRVHLALAIRQQPSTALQGRAGRMLTWLHRHIEAWGNRLGTAPAEEHV